MSGKTSSKTVDTLRVAHVSSFLNAEFMNWSIAEIDIWFRCLIDTNTMSRKNEKKAHNTNENGAEKVNATTTNTYRKTDYMYKKGKQL